MGNALAYYGGVPKQCFSNEDYASAFSIALKLTDNKKVNFLKKEKWFSNFNFCNCIADNESLLNAILCLNRADELLYNHFTTKWVSSDKDSPIPFQLEVIKLAPELFVKLIRVSQSFLKNQWYCYANEIELPSHLAVHK